MEAVFREILASPLGPVGFAYAATGRLTGIHLPRQAARMRPCGRRPRGAPSRAAVARWLAAFCRGESAGFPGAWDLPGAAPFERKVYRTVSRIAPGRTRSYGEVAAACGSPGAARAVGNAMARNPLPLLVPCHRVVATHGLGGFGGGLSLKRGLLELEGAVAAAGA